MKHKSFHFSSTKNIYFLSRRNLGFTLSLGAGLTALLVTATGSNLLTGAANAGAAPKVIAQAPTTAKVIYVNPATGQDNASAGATEAAPYKTITFALTQAQPGTIIRLAPGTYNQESGETFPLLLKSGVSLQGDEATKGQGILITGAGFYTSRTFARQEISILADNNSTIAGVTVTNPTQRGTGIWVESTNPIIQNSTFTNNGREGVFVTGTGNPRIEGNVFVQNKGNGISLARAAQGEVRNNLFQDTGFGLAIGGTATTLVESNQIIQNQDGLFISDSAKPVLRKNVIQNNKRDGVVAITAAQPDLGTNENPGGNLIRGNTRYDINNATKANTIVAVGNDVDQKKILGQVDFVAAKVDVPEGPVAFKDVPTAYWARSYIEALASQNIIAGFPDGTFRPNEPVTRAQFATIVTKALNPANKRAAINFKDVPSNFWAAAAIRSAYQGQFVSGYPDGTFKPQQQIPRVQALVALANGLGLTATSQNVLSFYSDAAQIPNYATGPVAAATSRQLVVNYPTVKQLEPNRQATRAEVAAFVYQALVNAGRAQPITSPFLVTVQ
jgi:parallel beta-helix repeat protein